MKKTKRTDTRGQTTGDWRFLLVPVAFFILLVGALTMIAFVRNSIYQSHVTLWADIVKRSPSKRRAHENYGQALSTAAAHATLPAERDRFLNKALHEFQTVIALKDDGSVPMRDLYRELGVVYFRLEQYDEAILYWQKGLQYAQNDPSLLNNLSIVMMQKRRFPEAATYAQAALAVDPFMPQALNTMAQVYLEKKDYGKAVEYFMAALERQPDVPQRYWNVALALGQAKKYDLALQYANRYVAMEGDPASRQRALGFIEHLKKSMGR